MIAASPREAYRTAALALQDVEREIEGERRRTPSEKYADLRARGLIALEAKAARIRESLIALKAAADAEPPRGSVRTGTDVRFKELEWLPAGTIDIGTYDFVPAIPEALRRAAA
jgi:hypothetical protein